MHLRIPVALLCLALAACDSVAPRPSAEAIAQLAPMGTLRVGWHLSDPFLVARDLSTGQYVGVPADLVRAMSARIDRPFDPTPYANAPALVASIGTGEWDIAFLAYDSALGSKVALSRPYV